MRTRRLHVIAALTIGVATLAAAQQPPAPAGAKDHVAAAKQSLQKSMAALRQYQWVETTVVSLKGEEKSRTQNSCYYGAEGALQKTPIGGAPEAGGRQPRGIRGKVAESKKEEISDAMKEAIALVKQYIPPDPTRIQAAKDSGRLSLTPPDSKGRVVVVIKDYLKAGDSLTLDLAAATDTITGVTVNSFTGSAKDAVGMKVAFGTFPDGSGYPATIHLDVAAQKLAVSVENSGYKKLGG